MPAPDPNPEPNTGPTPAPHAADRPRDFMARRLYIALGGNVGDVRASFVKALAILNAEPGIRVRAVSSLFRTAPVGPIPQPQYLNAVVTATTALAGTAVLGVLQRIERELGRDRASEQRWGPRTLDLDLLVCGEDRIDLPGLTVPHPRLAERRFVLAPLAELDPGLRPPGADATVAELLARLPDDGGLAVESAGPGWAATAAGGWAEARA